MQLEFSFLLQLLVYLVLLISLTHSPRETFSEWLVRYGASMGAVKIYCISLFELHDLQTPKMFVQDHAPCPVASLTSSKAFPTHPHIAGKALWEDRSIECDRYLMYVLQLLACSMVLKARMRKCTPGGMQRMLHSSKRMEKWVGKKAFCWARKR